MSKSALKIALLLGGLAALFCAVKFTPLSGYFTKETLLPLFENIKTRWWGPLFFVLIYGLACAAALPGSLLTLVGGAIFGTWLGTLYNLTGATLGASLAFFMARFLGRDFVKGLLKGGKMADFDDKVRQSGFRTIFRLRLIPLVPFNGLNFGAGFSSVSFRDYLLGTALGMIPGCFIYTYFADALLKGVQGAGQKALLNLAAAGALLIAVSFLPGLLAKRAKKTS